VARARSSAAGIAEGRARNSSTSRLLSQIGTRAHRNSGVGLGQGGCVVDAVAHHGHAQAAFCRARMRAACCRIKAGFDLEIPLGGLWRGCGGRVAVSISTRSPARRKAATASGIVAQCVAAFEATRRHAIQRHPQPRHAQFRRRQFIR